MFSLAASNIRGMNLLPKQKEVQEMVRCNNLGICAILETHVLPSNLQRICNNVFGNWQWVSNSSSCIRYTRVIVGWDPGKVNLMVLNHIDQVLHCQV